MSVKNPRTLRAGDEVLVRGARWRVTAIRSGDANQVVALVGMSASNAGECRSLITPFDLFEAARPHGRLRMVSLARWRRACRSVLREAMTRDSSASMWTAADAAIDLHAYQLEPALAVIRGVASRVLIADEVGLGKTIQSGLIAAELSARGAADRVLFVVPSGVREQWMEELKTRFGIEAVVMDTKEGRRRAALLPVGVNPWTTVPIAVTSIDYVRRAEVLAQVGECRWDLAVIDEAHGVASGRERRVAADAICDRAAHVVLLTATPHNGDRRAFQSLCELGSRGGDSLLIFRRTRAEVTAGRERSVHRVLVTQADEERRIFSALAELSRAVEADGADNSTPRLALALLYKRAYSSAYSVAETAGRRMRAMDTDAPARSLQMLLPLASDDDFEMADEAPLLTAPLLQDERRERALLACLVDAASAAMPMESKLAVLQRLLRRLAAMREHAIVFTEYRDTLLHVARRLRQAHGVVHGGMTAAERRSVIGSFVRGTTNLLLATDAASEGLNLQASCRVVINLELPWSPVRLEQRIGRVDRLGQERRVHVFHLIGRDTNESDVASRLIERVRRSAEDVGATDPLGTSAAEWIEPATPRFRMVDEARTELARLRAIRASGFADDPSAHTQDVLIATCGRRALRLATGRRPVALFREAVEDETGRAVAIRVTGVIAAAGEAGRPRDRASRLLAAAEGARYGGANADDAWPRESVAAYGQFWTTRRSREENSAASAATEERPAQAGLFDRQLEHERQAHLEKREEQQRATRDRMAGITRAATTRLVRARPALVLLP